MYPTHPPPYIIIIPSFIADSKVDLKEFKDTSRLLTRESVKPLKEEKRERRVKSKKMIMFKSSTIISVIVTCKQTNNS